MLSRGWIGKVATSMSVPKRYVAIQPDCPLAQQTLSQAEFALRPMSDNWLPCQHLPNRRRCGVGTLAHVDELPQHHAHRRTLQEVDHCRRDPKRQLQGCRQRRGGRCFRRGCTCRCRRRRGRRCCSQGNRRRRRGCGRFSQGNRRRRRPCAGSQCLHGNHDDLCLRRFCIQRVGGDRWRRRCCDYADWDGCWWPGRGSARCLGDGSLQQLANRRRCRRVSDYDEGWRCRGCDRLRAIGFH